jgi:hypothetical protein
MSRFCALVLACIGALALGVAPTSAKEDATDYILSVLDNQEINLGDKNINDTPLFEMVQELSKKYNLTFTINEESFKAFGQQNIKEEKPRLAATQLRGLTPRQFLTVVLDGLGATFLVRNGAIEIVPVQYAAKVTKAGVSQEDAGPARLSEVLVSTIIKDKALSDAVAKIADTYDLTVVVAPQAAEARTKQVTARLLNVPADQALELLAVQCDLRVVRRGSSYLITSREHATELFDEKLQKERKQLDLQKLRDAPAKPSGK